MQIPHLKELGINAVEILPVFEYDELEFQRSPNSRDHMVNIWGYSHINFFAPMSVGLHSMQHFAPGLPVCLHMCPHASRAATAHVDGGAHA